MKKKITTLMVLLLLFNISTQKADWGVFNVAQDIEKVRENVTRVNTASRFRNLPMGPGPAIERATKETSLTGPGPEIPRRAEKERAEKRPWWGSL